MIPTYYMLEMLREKYTDLEFNFIMGSDLMPGIIEWDDGDKFLNEYGFICFERVGYEHLRTADFTRPKNY